MCLQMGSVQTVVSIFRNVGKNVVEHGSPSTRFSARINFIFLLRITRYYTGRHSFSPGCVVFWFYLLCIFLSNLAWMSPYHPFKSWIFILKLKIFNVCIYNTVCAFDILQFFRSLASYQLNSNLFAEIHWWYSQEGRVAARRKHWH